MRGRSHVQILLYVDTYTARHFDSFTSLEPSNQGNIKIRFIYLIEK
jgi:hypothetical protein